ncbi:NADH-ubiquinone oxidoreductase 21 kDa subunit [Elsinoe ampelina]|uniref:NADH-ubiquinone oxidoreductase 21 kDa subunit n=1 Tax=Elsinoe ampelina TaxID=302913 RepID=A0A6A6GKQ7_9PEZI|nr:NADH-ubiquinone oxidoreductase 21 kDa subunit [Elsinoe ampelina]
MSEAPPLETPQQTRPVLPSKQLPSDYPLIDNDPHFKRVVRYARPSDYAWGAGVAAAVPAAFIVMDRVSPFPGLPKNLHRGPLRLNYFLGATAGFLYFYSRSINRFYGFTENRREVELDMREMTDKVKKGEPLYGTSSLSEYMQGVASRQTRYTGVNLAILPWFNFVNHPYHGVDTAKYYQNAERELEAEKGR